MYKEAVFFWGGGGDSRGQEKDACLKVTTAVTMEVKGALGPPSDISEAGDLFPHPSYPTETMSNKEQK